MFYHSHRAIVCAIARQMRYHLKTSAEARARVVEAEAECHDEDGDGFVVCGHCGEGGGDHATEDCPSVEKECTEQCGVCCEDVSDEQNVGCCRDGECPNTVEVMCRDCGTWDKKEEVWRCEICQAEHEATQN